MKKIILPLIVFIFTPLALLFFFHFPEEEMEPQEWTTFTKTKNDLIAHPTTSAELKKAQLRTVASIKNEKKVIERTILGEIGDKKDLKKIDFINKINPDWKKNLAKILLEGGQKDDRVLIKRNIGIIEVDNLKGRYLEQVVVTYISDNHEQNSFNALVDSESGQIIKTWNKTITENFKKKSQGLSPSGTL